MSKGYLFAEFCNSEGISECGTDSWYRLDGRDSLPTQIEDCRQRRGKFKKNFPHKFNSWTHVKLHYSIKDRGELFKL